MKLIRYISISAIIAFSLIFLVMCPAVLAQEDAQEEDAKVLLKVDGDIPFIEVGKDTVINITFMDRGDLNWTDLMKKFPYILMKVEWPIVFGPEVAEWLGYHSIDFYPEIKGNISGWHAWMEPSEIVGSTSGTTAKLKLHVRLDGRTESNTAIIRIKCVRRGVTGKPIGVSYSEIAVAAKPYHYLEVLPLESKKVVFPGSTVTIPVDLKNLGNFVDTFHISVAGEKGVIGIASDQVVVLNPGESQRIYIQATSPITLFDIGTPKNLKILVYSIHDPDNVFTGEIALINRGVYLPFLVILIIVVIAAVALLRVYRHFKESYMSHRTEREGVVEEKEKYEKEELTKPVEERREKLVEFKPLIEEEPITKKPKKERTKKDKLKERILREQEKQKRKFKKYQ